MQQKLQEFVPPPVKLLIDLQYFHKSPDLIPYIFPKHFFKFFSLILGKAVPEMSRFIQET